MPNNISITDLYGNEITTDQPFILVHIQNSKEYMMSLDNSDLDSVWTVNHVKMGTLLETYGLNYKNYSQLGHYWIPNNKNKIGNTTIILCNINYNIFQFPNTFKRIGVYESGYLWQPVGPSYYKSLGLVYSPIEPDIHICMLVRSDYICPYYGWNMRIYNITNMNEFRLLNTRFIPRLTVDRTKFIKESSNITISQNGKYVCRVGDKLLVSKFANNKSSSCVITYTDEGYLMIGDKYIGLKTNKTNAKNNKVYLNKTKSLVNKWYFYKNNIISQYNKLCLKIHLNYLITVRCNKNLKWNVEIVDNKQLYDEDNDDYSIESDYIVPDNPYVTVDENNPWYVNKVKRPAELIKRSNELNELSYKNYGNYKSKFKLDKNREHGGYGHSYVSRLGKPCNEHFTVSSINDNNICVVLSVIIIILLLCYRFIK